MLPNKLQALMVWYRILNFNVYLCLKGKNMKPYILSFFRDILSVTCYEQDPVHDMKPKILFTVLPGNRKDKPSLVKKYLIK
jgi:hypothetical protein